MPFLGRLKMPCVELIPREFEEHLTGESNVEIVLLRKFKIENAHAKES